jgi:hypothetical protein
MGTEASGRTSKFIVATKLKGKLTKVGVPKNPKDVRERQRLIEYEFLSGHINHLTAKFMTDSNLVMLKALRAEDSDLIELREMAASLEREMAEGRERETHSQPRLGRRSTATATTW